MEQGAYGYRDDPAVPTFDDSRGLVVFDGECILCSRSTRLLVRLDRKGRFRLTTAQGPLGQALYRHAGLPVDRFETFLVVIGGRIHAKSDAIVAMAGELPWPARAGTMLRLIPRTLRDALYSAVARHRYRLFGRTTLCGLVSREMRDRLV